MATYRNANMTLKDTISYPCFLRVSSPFWESYKLVPGFWVAIL